MSIVRRFFKKRMDIYAPFGVIIVLSPWQLSGEAALICYILGLAFFIMGGLLRFWGGRYCGKRRRHGGERRLSTTGPFALCRNPLYLANILITIGFILFAHLWWLVPFFIVYALIRYTIIVKREEKGLEERFGEEYLSYKKRVRRWLPNPLALFKGSRNPLYRWSEVMRREMWGMVACIFALIFLFFKNRLFERLV